MFNLGSEWEVSLDRRVRRTCITAIAVVTANASLQIHRINIHAQHLLTSQDLPDECAKRSRGLSCTAHMAETYTVAQEDCECDKAREPEQHRQRFRE